MSRNGSGVYSLPAGTAAVTGDAISSTKFNTLTEDLEADANEVRPIVAGGTGAATAAAARTALGLAIGTDVQAFDAGLTSLAALGSAADKYLYTTAADTWAEGDITSFARTILDDADAATVRTTLSLVPGTNVQAYDAGLASIAGLTTLADRMIYTTASDTYAVTTLTSFARTLLDDTTAGAALTTLGGQTLDATLTALAGLSVTNGDFIKATGTDTFSTYASSLLPTLAGDQTFTGNININESGSTAAFGSADNLVIRNESSDAGLSIFSSTTGRILVCFADSTSTVRNRIESYASSHATQANDIVFVADSSEVFRWDDSADEFKVTGSGVIRPAAGSVTTGSLTAVANANRVTQLTGNPTITGSVFTAGDVLVLYAGSAARTITQGAGMTMRLDGTATTGSRTLAARGMAAVYMISATECVVSGGAVS